jgi:membrane fusion protein, multidrug efflux system
VSVKPGMSVVVKMPAGYPKNVVVVPAVAIRRSAWGTFVYLVEKNKDGQDVAKKTNIVVGTSLGEWVIVESGVKLGDMVVADGSFKLMDGAVLALTPATTQPATQAAK